MRTRSARRLVTLLAIPMVLVCAGTAGTSQAWDDGHGQPAGAAGHDEHAKAAPAGHDEHAQPTAKPAAPASATKTVEPKPTGMSMVEGKPEGRAATKPKPAEMQEPPTTAEAAMKVLQEGNQRWVADKDENPNTEPARRASLAEKGQKPFVTVLTCADSRLPVERVFDRGVGEVFVVRVAGNVAGTSETGTIEYAVEHLKTPLLVVMGHTKCGAVAAAASGAELHGALGDLVGAIKPAVERVKRNNPNADEKQVAPLAVKENVWQSITDLFRRSPEVRAAAGKGELKVVGAVYDIATGKVEWMGEHPWQTELLEAFNSRGRKSTESADADKHDEK